MFCLTVLIIVGTFSVASGELEIHLSIMFMFSNAKKVNRRLLPDTLFWQEPVEILPQSIAQLITGILMETTQRDSQCPSSAVLIMYERLYQPVQVPVQLRDPGIQHPRQAD